MAYKVGLRKISPNLVFNGVSTPLSVDPLFVSDFTVICPSTNVGNCYIGDSTVDSTWAPLLPSEWYQFTHGTGNFIGLNPVVSFDLSKIFFFADNIADSIIVQYIFSET